MKIAIVGGTGRIGEGFACRWAPYHEILVGSREIEKAEVSAGNYKSELRERGIKCEVLGCSNREAIDKSDLVIMSVPYQGVIPLVQQLRDSFKNQIVVSLVVPMKKNQWYEYTPPSQGSAALWIKDLLPKTVRVVSAYHNLSFRKLADLDQILENDVVVCGDDEASKKTVMELTQQIKNLRALDGGPLGPLASSYLVESLTPFLMNLATRNNLSDLGVKFV